MYVSFTSMLSVIETQKTGAIVLILLLVDL